MKVDKYLTKDGLIEIQCIASESSSNSEIARKLGISRETLRRWTKKHPEIAEAIKKGREVLVDDVMKSLIKRAIGKAQSTTIKYEMHENENGEIEEIPVRKTVVTHPPDVNACIILLQHFDRYHPVKNPSGFLVNPAEQFNKEFALLAKGAFYNPNDMLELAQEMQELQQNGLPKEEDSAQEDTDDKKE